VEGRLDGRHALVTGAASGIGRATVIRLASHGAAVVVNHTGGSAAGEVVAQIAEAGGRAVAIEADVSDEQQVQAMFSRAREELGAVVDTLVNNAGIEMPHDLVDMPLEDWNKVLGVNLTGAFLCSRECARALLAAKAPGVIVNVSSVHEVIPWKRFSHYAASKGGLKLFGQSIAKELAPHGIRVVAVAPGAIETPMNKAVLRDPETRRGVESHIPQGRWGKPEEIAAAISWLASDEAAYVTGSTLFVDGGMLLYPNVD
jgi:glucose 1-dehydrogenase